jgi:hypothetical protein
MSLDVSGDPFVQLREPDRLLVFRFLATFSRFEYALKCHTQYLRADRGGAAMPSWHSFARANRGKFAKLDDSHPVHDAIRYLRASPPHRQIVDGGRLGWAKIFEDPSDEVFALSCVRTMRNNLFHGGKFPWDIERDRELLRHGCVILNESLNCDHELRTHFDTG